jgi:hypothetical protein
VGERVSGQVGEWVSFAFRGWGVGSESPPVQGYLAHKKQPPPPKGFHRALWALGLEVGSERPLARHVRTGSWMGPPQGKKAPRVGPTFFVILSGLEVGVWGLRAHPDRGTSLRRNSPTPQGFHRALGIVLP